MGFVEMKYAFLVVSIIFLASCGGGSGTSDSGNSSSPSAVDRVVVDVLQATQTSSSTSEFQKLLLSGQTTQFSLDDLGIESAIDINIQSENSTTKREGNTLFITAPQVDHFTLDTINIVVTNESGETTSTQIEVAYFPHNNGELGWSLQGENTPDKVNLIFLGDGYRQEEQLLFFQHIDLIIEKMESDEGIGPYMSAWSVHGIFTPSLDSGIDPSPNEDSKRTFFDGHFGCFDIDRLICADNDMAENLVDNQYSHYDVVAMIVNDERRGGAGGKLAIFSYQNVHTALHELGHTFAGLADEYVDESISDLYADRYVEGNFPNVSTHADPNDVPWKHWIDDKRSYPSGYENGVGLFAGSYYHASGFFRPTLSSVMRSSSSPFGPVNTEAWVKNIYKKSSPLKSYHPNTRNLVATASESITFSVDIPFDLTLQNVRWYIDDVEQKSLDNQLVIELALNAGRHEVKVVADDVASVRDWTDTNVSRSNVWEIEVF